MNYETPARCSGCRAKSEPRPLGQTPPGWARDEDGQGRYWCPACSPPLSEKERT